MLPCKKYPSVRARTGYNSMTKKVFFMHKTIRLTVIAALFAALVCVTTMMIRIPTPSTGGYVHLGNCFCLLAAFLLPAPWGIAASGIGTMLADLIGYPVYAPASLIIMCAVAAIAGGVYRLLMRDVGHSPRYGFVVCILSGILGEALMIVGYFVFNAWIRGKGMAALPSVPGNIMQAIFGIVPSAFLMQVVMRNPAIRNVLDRAMGVTHSGH